MWHGLGAHLDGYHDAALDLWRHVERRTVAALGPGPWDAGDPPPSDELRARQVAVREALADAIGGLPHTPEGFSASATVVKQREIPTGPGRPCVVETIVFQSRPGVYVTANVYRPAGHGAGGEAAAPGIVFLCGHAESGKASKSYQRAAMTLAANGFTVLSFDPIGQGERLSYLDPEAAVGSEAPQPVVAWGTAEHSYAGLQCWWNGTSLLHHMIADAQAAIQVLTEAYHVDPSAIGATGNSGGGMLTAVLAAIDERVAAAAPGTFITSRIDYLASGGRQDAEQILTGMTALGMDHSALLIAAAPRPVHVLAARSDFFPIEGTRRTFADARIAYAAVDAAHQLTLFEADSPHTYHPTMIDSAVRFFRRTLTSPGWQPPADIWPASATETVNEPTLQATETGQVATAFTDAVFVADLLATTADISAESPTVSGARQWLAAPLTHRESLTADRQVRWLPGTHHDTHVMWPAEGEVWGSGIITPATETPVKCRRIVLLDNGTDDYTEHMAGRALQSDDEPTLYLDVRGRGPLTPYQRGDADPRSHASSTYKILTDLMCLGESLAIGQVGDILVALELLGADTVDLVGHGYGAYLARLTAFIAPDRIRSLELHDERLDPERIVRTRLWDTGHGDWQGVIFGLQRHAPWHLIQQTTSALT